MKRLVFFKNLVQGDGAFLFVLPRLRLYGKGYGRLGIFDAVVDNRSRLVAQGISRLRLSQLNAGDDVARVSFVDFIKLLALHDVQTAQPFLHAARRVVDRGVRGDVAADNLHDVDAAREGVRDGAEDVSGKG